MIRTDQRSLRFLMSQWVLREDQRKWVMKQLVCDFEIQHRPGCENKAADALSRQMEEILELSALSRVQVAEVDAVGEEVSQDEKLKSLLQDLLKDSNSHRLKHGVFI